MTSPRGRLASFFVAWSLAGVSVAALAQPHFAPTQLGDMNFYSSSGLSVGYSVHAILDNDRVWADYSYASRGGAGRTSAIWDVSDPAHPLQLQALPSGSRSIDSAGRALVRNGTSYTVGDAGAGGSGMYAYALNDHGVVIGGTDDGRAYWNNVDTFASGEIVAPGITYFNPADVNNGGLIVGGTLTGGFIYDLNTGAFESIAGGGAQAVNEAGTVIGTLVGDGPRQVFMKHAGDATLINLSALPGAPIDAIGQMTLNNLGQVGIGQYFFDGTQWTDLRAYFKLPGNVQLLDLEDDGSMLMSYQAVGALNGGGNVTSHYILTPSDHFPTFTFLPEPSSYALMGMGLLGMAAVSRARRRAS